MKQKLIIAVLLLMAVLLTAACGSSSPPEESVDQAVPEETALETASVTESTESETASAAEDTESETASAQKRESPESMSVQEEGTETEVFDGPVANSAIHLTDMTSTMDALVRCCADNGYSYSTDPWFFWTAMSYHLGANYDLNRDQITVGSDSLRVPRSVVSEYVEALFADFSELPEIPQELHDRISYDQATDSYQVAKGEASLTQLVLGPSNIMDDGSVLVSATLISLNENRTPLSEWEIELIPNPHLSTTNDSAFHYSIISLELIAAHSPLLLSNAQTVTFVRLEDNHTAIFAEKGGEELVCQFHDETISQILNNAVIGSRYSLTLSIDTKTKTWTIHTLEEL